MRRQPAPVPVVRPLERISRQRLKELAQSGFINIVIRDEYGDYMPEGNQIVVRISPQLDVTTLTCEGDSVKLYISGNEGYVNDNSVCNADETAVAISLAEEFANDIEGSYGGEQVADRDNYYVDKMMWYRD